MTQRKRGVTADDLYRLVVVGDPQASSDGTQIAWVQSQAHEHLNGYRSSIWIAEADGSSARQLTSGQHRDATPRWSPDGRSLAFVSNRPAMLPKPDDETPASGSAQSVSQIWTIATEGGEAIQRTTHPRGADSPVWSPDGNQIAFVASDLPSDDERSEAPTVIGPIADERVVQDVHYRADGKGWLDTFSHLWVVRLDDGAERELTTGPAQDGSPAWSPDGSTIAFVSNRTSERRRRWNRQVVYTIPAAGGAIAQITPAEARFSNPAWSPDGASLALMGHLETSSYLLDRIWTVGADGDGLTCLTEAADTEFGDAGMGDLALAGENGPVWRDEETLLALASKNGETQVFSVATADGGVTPLTTGRHRISGFAPLPTGLVVARGGIARPFELAGVPHGATELRDVTTVNVDFLNEVELVEAVDLALTSGDGTSIQGWILPPRGADVHGDVQHAVIVQIHGGPHSMYGYSLFHEMQLMAAKGYAVAFANPRGSAGYGQEFLSCTRGIWGEADMPDVIALADAVSALPWIDSDRLGITGGSYGGYLTNWIVGHDQRFRAAVTQRCVSNFNSFFGTSDIGTTFGVDEFDGLPWSDHEKLHRHSPVAYVDRITTPLLILHSEQDLRCPIEQAEQMYAALAYLGREVGFVRFPEEGHDLSRSGKPGRRIARLHHLLGWFDRYL